ncbi:Cad1p NDAI_0H01610 [Naumovozyma dairenensis CBS 421]|uniref:Transcription factor PAP1 domain-containing protein n=1 Tax=Naumovozyma dairenensis (strain ATCC 10597 / BCRC 20456 / CBS 421 / NBRC 0211 / NRRL Y-12639) TaxID=1071378 RepID=G0WEX4_NAUDC|nr:hypothetical protein NDAI_0H01610 [Naumovozyma dairenensis CBS 421]CCD26335.1 hypothetical protein NDAI_0H01610 [Naumovozyma dairenensis CBS 421]
MKELEDKISSLEKIKDENSIETSFLRSYMTDLINEVNKFRPKNTTDSKILKYLSMRNTHMHNNPPNIDTLLELEKKRKEREEREQQQQQFHEEEQKQEQVSHEKNSHLSDTNTTNNTNTNQLPANQVPSPNESSGSSIVSNTSSPIINKTNASNFKIDSFNSPISVPISTTNNNSSFSNKYDINQVNDSNNVPIDGGGTDSHAVGTNIPNKNWMDNVFENNIAEGLPPFLNNDDPEKIANMNNHTDTNNNLLTTGNLLDNSLMFSNDFNFNNQFDEHVTNLLADSLSRFPSDGNHHDSNIISKSNSSLTSPAQSLMLTNTWDTNNSPSLDGIDTDNNIYVNDDSNKDTASIMNVRPIIDSTLAFPSTMTENDLFAQRYGTMQSSSSSLSESAMQLGDDKKCTCNDQCNSDDEEIECELLSRNLLNDESMKSIIKEKQTRPSNVAPSCCNGGYGNRFAKCSKIWERINNKMNIETNSGPRFKDSDIDDLCNELMTKARCSTNGSIVIKTGDIKQSLMKHF